MAVPARALAIGSHPDDVEFGAGATLARWAEAGCEVHLLVLTDGSKGSWDGAADLRDLVAIRETEARAAAARLGAADVVFLGYPDGELQSGLAEREAVCRVIRDVRPEVLIGHDPWQRYRLHPDHRHAGWLTVDGLVAARDPHFFPAAGPHHRPGTLLLFEADEPNHWEPAEAHLGAKVAALLEHRSQWHSTMGIQPGQPEEAAQHEAFVAEVRRRATPADGIGPRGLFEAFRAITRT
ncbi:MAG: PIG-L deacetylase family protein [Actinomycetes bacterium]